MIVSVNRFLDPDAVEKVKELFRRNDPEGIFRLILVVDHTVDPYDLHMVAWQILGNSDPKRDHEFITPSSLIIDGTIKAFRKGGFPVNGQMWFVQTVKLFQLLTGNGNHLDWGHLLSLLLKFTGNWFWEEEMKLLLMSPELLII